MKKIISMILVLALVMSFGITAFASDEGNHNADVFATYVPFEEDISINIEWGSMAFVYYDGVVDNQDGRWEPAQENANKIFLTNNCASTYLKVDFEFAFVENAAELGLGNVGFTWGRYDLDGNNGEDSVGNGYTVLVTERVTNTVTHHAEQLVLNLNGVPTQALDNVTIGEVTLTVSEYVGA